jgi:hypothetical protein
MMLGGWEDENGVYGYYGGGWLGYIEFVFPLAALDQRSLKYLYLNDYYPIYIHIYSISIYINSVGNTSVNTNIHE